MVTFVLPYKLPYFRKFHQFEHILVFRYYSCLKMANQMLDIILKQFIKKMESRYLNTRQFRFKEDLWSF